MTYTVYTKNGCSFCAMLKTLLEQHGIEYNEINISEDPESREFVLAEGHRTVPQIYKDGKLAVDGGYTGMKALLETKTVINSTGEL